MVGILEMLLQQQLEADEGHELVFVVVVIGLCNET